LFQIRVVQQKYKVATYFVIHLKHGFVKVHLFTDEGSKANNADRRIAEKDDEKQVAFGINGSFVSILLPALYYKNDEHEHTHHCRQPHHAQQPARCKSLHPKALTGTYGSEE
jgi:hypothetical protein